MIISSRYFERELERPEGKGWDVGEPELRCDGVGREASSKKTEGLRGTVGIGEEETCGGGD